MNDSQNNLSQNLPSEIQKALDEASKDLKASPLSELPLHSIQKLFDLSEIALADKSRSFFLELANITISRVIDKWQLPLFWYSKGDPEFDYWEDLPATLLIKAKQDLPLNDTLIVELNHLEEVDSLTGQYDPSPYFHSWLVFSLTLQLLRAKFYDYSYERMLGREFFKYTSEHSLEEVNTSVDFATLTSVVYAGGVWVPQNTDDWWYSNETDSWITKNESWYTEDDNWGMWERRDIYAAAKRFEFWNWWLNEAFILAWNTVG